MKLFLGAGALFLALAVMTGALGAHGLKDKMTPDMLEVYRTAVDYHFYHALGLLALGLIMGFYPNSPVLFSVAGSFLILGILLFSGTLYALALTGITWLGAITPIGGLAFIIGWLVVLVGVAQA